MRSVLNEIIEDQNCFMAVYPDGKRQIVLAVDETEAAECTVGSAFVLSLVELKEWTKELEEVMGSPVDDADEYLAKHMAQIILKKLQAKKR